jgi:hypothetical protein
MREFHQQASFSGIKVTEEKEAVSFLKSGHM